MLSLRLQVGKYANITFWKALYPTGAVSAAAQEAVEAAGHAAAEATRERAEQEEAASWDAGLRARMRSNLRLSHN